jgi:hypothetical protein
MCEDCFSKEYPEFKSYPEYNEFVAKLDTKLERTIHFLGTTDNKWDLHYLYECNSCKQIWCLSEPDNHWHGYFLTEANAKTFIKNEYNRGLVMKLGCTLLLSILVFILIKSCA